MLIRPFIAQDLSALVTIFNQECSQSSISEDEFVRLHVADMNFDALLCLVAVDKGAVVGFLFGIKRKISYFSRGKQEDTAWIKFMAVNKEFQSKGIGAKLLQVFQERVKESNTSIIILGMYSPSYVFSGVDINNTKAIRFFEYHGYIKKEYAYQMERSLLDYVTPLSIIAKKEALLQEGYIFIPFETRYAYSLLSMIQANFSEGWLSYVINAIKNKTAASEIILCIKQDEVVGYVSRASIDDDPCRFGPFGVSEPYRNKKLGEILIHEMFTSMKAENLISVYFKSTEEKGKRFYLRQGMEVKRTYQKYEKVIDYSF